MFLYISSNDAKLDKETRVGDLVEVLIQQRNDPITFPEVWAFERIPRNHMVAIIGVYDEDHNVEIGVFNRQLEGEVGIEFMDLTRWYYLFWNFHLYVFRSSENGSSDYHLKLDYNNTCTNKGTVEGMDRFSFRRKCPLITLRFITL